MHKRTIVATVLSISLILTGMTTLSLAHDTAAEALTQGGSLTVGTTPIKLTQPSDPGMGKLIPAKNATTRGMFGPELPWSVVPIHLALARNGHLIAYGTPFENGTTQAGILFDNWNPAAGSGAASHVQSDSMGYDSFCNSLVTMQNGKILMVGGNSTMSTMIYDPRTGTSVKGADLNLQRWYATTLALPSGRILVLGGSEYYNLHKVTNLPPGMATGTTPEIGDGIHPWRKLTGAANLKAFGNDGTHWFYPRAFNWRGDTVIGFSGRQLWTLDPAGKGSVKLVGTLPFDPGPSGSQVMYAPGKLLIASGGAHSPDAHRNASASAVTVDFNTKKPTIRKTSNVLYPGNWLNLTVLPNGKVLANGGTRFGTAAGTANSQRTAELWNPATGKWSSMATAQRTRTYHSTSLLMPSGAVITAGSGAAPYTDGTGSGPENNMNAELYYPAYLFTKDKQGKVHWASRPAITTIAGHATYGGSMKLGLRTSEKISGVDLITAASVTHSQNTNQRRIELQFTQHGKSLSATLPKDTKVLPPGDYELTVVNSKGVPSPSQMLTFRVGKAGLITPPAPTIARTQTGDMAGMHM